jgi:pyrimidine-specific ribonucleoside hydrolase
MKCTNMKKIISACIAFIFSIIITAHPWKPNHYVIIDTDGGIDDMRTLSLMFSSPDVRVLGITVSPGALNAATAYIKVKSLLISFYHEGIPVGINRSSQISSPLFEAALNYKWGDESGINPEDAPDYLNVIGEILKWEKTPVSFICLGGLSSAASAIREIPEFNSRVKQVIWSSSGLNDPKGFNYSIDAASAAIVSKNSIPLRVVVPSGDNVFFTAGMQLEIERIASPYSKKIRDTFKEAAAHDYILRANDETVPVFLHYPALFKTLSSGKNSQHTVDNMPGFNSGFIKILKGETVTKNQVIKQFPADTSFYFSDIAPSVKEITDRYGEEEWVSGIIANELHRHLGVFAIVGVKMGIRAREYFDTGVDEFSVTSFAGSAPPLSCMNDGIQVSTGATTGHGLLTVINDPTAPAAEFRYLNHRIRITLIPEIAEKITGELKGINFVYGLDSNIYWELVRKNSIRYWKELDRHQIFKIEIIE